MPESKSILFVDDDSLFLASQERQLRGLFKVDLCTSAHEALDKIEQRSYAVVVADYHMPGMDGVRFLQQVCELAPQTVRILFTGHAELEVAIAAVNEGRIFRFLSKPCPVDELIQALRLALGHYRSLFKQQEEAEQHAFQALHDSLTGLPNRSYFAEKLKEVLALTRRNKSLAALLFIDLDGFKAVNDTLGHAAGDKLLQTVARLLQGSVREVDVVARYAGDEFVVILQGLSEQKQAEMLAERILKNFSLPIELQGVTQQVGMSIGVALYPSHTVNAEELVKLADKTMYSAKQAGGSTWRLAAESHPETS